jgi:hypothetical protein
MVSVFTHVVRALQAGYAAIRVTEIAPGAAVPREAHAVERTLEMTMKMRKVYPVAIALLAVMCLPTVARGQGCAHGASETPEAQQRRMSALSAARFINTVEVNHRRRQGAYLPFGELGKSSVVSDLNKKGSLYQVFQTMSFDSDKDVVPGFELRFTLGRDSYSFRLTDRNDPCGFSYFSDPRGVIYEGQAIGSLGAVTQ